MSNTMTTEEFDAAVNALRGKVVPQQVNKKKSDCTPEEWASRLDYRAKWCAENPESNRHSKDKWVRTNPQKRRQSARESLRKACSTPGGLGRVRKNRRESAARNPGTGLAWRDRNRPRVNELARNRWRAKTAEARAIRESQIESRRENSRLKLRLRLRLNKAIRSKTSRNGSAVRDLGCSIEELWVHLESRFQPGMTRQNIGKAWVIDHIYPLAKAKLTDRVEFLAVNNWKNLQPLTADQNNDKSDYVSPEAQALFDRLKVEFAGARQST